MRPEDVPAELVDPGRNAMIRHLRASGPGIPTFEEKVRVVLAAVLPEHEKQVRQKVAEEACLAQGSIRSVLRGAQ